MEHVPKYTSEILLLVFMTIIFLQSSTDKLIYWNKNLEWFKVHFKKTTLKNMEELLLANILLAEALTGILCLIGIFQIIAFGETEIAQYGAILSCVSLLILLFGQRVAKDYQGAMTITVYFIPAIFLVFLLSL